ncbi:hypothetical protein BDW22DRAFT_1266694 [Trametopsis cervina]|nr:hypothetical protein BDW22DRAFT_1266694 [Trametopsis cervina]
MLRWLAARRAGWLARRVVSTCAEHDRPMGAAITLKQLHSEINADDVRRQARQRGSDSSTEFPSIPSDCALFPSCSLRRLFVSLQYRPGCPVPSRCLTQHIPSKNKPCYLRTCHFLCLSVQDDDTTLRISTAAAWCVVSFLPGADTYSTVFTEATQTVCSRMNGISRSTDWYIIASRIMRLSRWLPLMRPLRYTSPIFRW